MEELVTGGIYQIRCRNFSVGVYDGNGGFIGIREKFGSRYLFTEYAAETSSVLGTVRQEGRTLIGTVPPDVPLLERLPTVCSACGTPATWGGRATGWTCEQGCAECQPAGVPNTALYRVLEQWEDPDPEREARLAKWNERYEAP